MPLPKREVMNRARIYFNGMENITPTEKAKVILYCKHSVNLLEKLKKGGFIESFWCGNPECAKGIRGIKKYSVRVVNQSKSAKKCVHCGNKSGYTATFAPAY